MSDNHRNATERRVWKVVRLLALDRDNWRCTKCGKAGQLEVHHILALKDGGKSELENVKSLCRTCHIGIHLPGDAMRRYSSGWLEMIQDLT